MLRILALAFPLLLSHPQTGCWQAATPGPHAISRIEFARLIHRLSEKDGYFWSNNYISNETSYLHPLGWLARLGIGDGVYVGVDLGKEQRNWLATAESYNYVRTLQQSNLIIPAVGDFAGDHAFRELGSLLHLRRETVSALYVSNVEFYLFRQGRWDRFVENVRRLPIDEHSVFIRSYANLHRPHPEMVGDHITVTLVQNIQKFLENADRGVYHDLWDVVTTDYLH